MNTWDLLALIARFLFYLGTFGSIGGFFILAVVPAIQNDQFFTSLKRSVFISSLLGLFASIFGFLLLVGSFSESGFKGMFDLSMIDILLTSNSGKEMQYRVGIFFLIGIFIAIKFNSNLIFLRLLESLTVLFLSIALCCTFFVSGHLFESALIQKAILAGHVFVASFWIGSLYPLILVCRTKQLSFISKTMERFSHLALVFVFLLILLGSILVYILVGSWDGLLSSNYGRGILMKLFLVSLLLMLAARHKWFLVPKLNETDKLNKLKTSIGIELFIGVLVLAATAVLTSVIGIEGTGGGH